jgi:hypothetical protein
MTPQDETRVREIIREVLADREAKAPCQLCNQPKPTNGVCRDWSIDHKRICPYMNRAH